MRTQIAGVKFFMHVRASDRAKPVENGKFWLDFPQMVVHRPERGRERERRGGRGSSCGSDASGKLKNKFATLANRRKGRLLSRVRYVTRLARNY